MTTDDPLWVIRLKQDPSAFKSFVRFLEDLTDQWERRAARDVATWEGVRQARGALEVLDYLKNCLTQKEKEADALTRYKAAAGS